MPDFNNMTTEQIVQHYQSRGNGSALDQPGKPIEYQADYARQAGEIDKDHRRTPEQKTRAKQLLSASALSRIGK